MVILNTIGDSGKNISSLFSMGSQGLSMSSLSQIFGLAILTTLIRAIIFSERLLKRWSLTARTIIMVVCCIAIIVVFIAMFDWFPNGTIVPWLFFSISFCLCFTISLVLTKSKQNRENKAMAEALEKLKKDE